MPNVVLIPDDIDRHGAGCGCGRCDANGKSVGVAIKPTPADALDDQVIDAAEQADPLDRLYAATLGAAIRAARQLCAEHGWTEIV